MFALNCLVNGQTHHFIDSARLLVVLEIGLDVMDPVQLFVHYNCLVHNGMYYLKD